MSRAKTIACPTCGKDVVWAKDNPWRPFCSERCKLIDLGAWANESYRVPDAEQPPKEDSSE
ncbi:MAG: DNA gyrase inhibitor YacG [Gammaproteobacteria bacterium]|nr:DNA gyrase inhibitor YacG [Gammaproteobacteria bacterium]